MADQLLRLDGAQWHERFRPVREPSPVEQRNVHGDHGEEERDGQAERQCHRRSREPGCIGGELLDGMLHVVVEGGRGQAERSELRAQRVRGAGNRTSSCKARGKGSSDFDATMDEEIEQAADPTREPDPRQGCAEKGGQPVFPGQTAQCCMEWIDRESNESSKEDPGTDGHGKDEDGQSGKDRESAERAVLS